MMIRFIFLSLFMIAGTTMASNEIGAPEGVSAEDWEAYLKHKKDWEAMLQQRFESELKANPPLPPWEKFPEYEPSNIFWRMGTGEEYLIDYFGVYLKYASKDDIQAYKLKYPAPKIWENWYNEN
ncbi:MULTISPECIES: hypothetical protein [Alteromonadales]|jgi:hypothetical protein|nr:MULTISPECIES: hypothetical protein [Alteromonadales]KTF17845.1 hypothetical protein ATS75_00010 [Pseudoalteromonas sp. H105]|tara:strand:- start:89 stop:460 length:372 start_codon:yes stop_codon:yes gene_type:complete